MVTESSQAEISMKQVEETKRLSNAFDSVKTSIGRGQEVKLYCWWIWNELLKQKQRCKTKQTKKGEVTINSRKNKELLEKKLLYFTTDSAVNSIYIVTVNNIYSY